MGIDYILHGIGRILDKWICHYFSNVRDLHVFHCKTLPVVLSKSLFQHRVNIFATRGVWGLYAA